MKPAAAAVEFAAISPARAVDEIAQQVRDMIASGTLKPGDRLPAERIMAERLRVGRNTLREALRMLEHAGILAMRKGASGGPYVRSGNPGAIINGLRDLYHLGGITPQQLTEARIVLSQAVVPLACKRATEADLQALEASVHSAAEAQAAGDFEMRARLNGEFHVLLARMTGNPILAIAMESVMAVFAQFIARIGPGENEFVLPSRRRFIKHLRDGNADAAVAEMTKSLTRLQTQYLNLWNTREALARA